MTVAATIAARQSKKELDWNDHENDSDGDDNDGLLHMRRQASLSRVKKDYDSERSDDSTRQISLPDYVARGRGGAGDNTLTVNSGSDNDDIFNNGGDNSGGIRSRRAIVEIPMRVVNRTSTLYTQPHSLLSMQTTFPLWKSSQRKQSLHRKTHQQPFVVVMLGQLSTTHVMRGKTGYSQGDAQVTCRIQRNSNSASSKSTSPVTSPKALDFNGGISTTAGNPKIALSTGATAILSSDSVVGTKTSVSANYSTTVGFVGGKKGGKKASPSSAMLNLSASRQFSSCILQSNCILRPASPSSSSSSQQGSAGGRASDGISVALFKTSLTLRTIQPWTVSLGWNPITLAPRQRQQAASSSSSNNRSWFLSFSTVPTIVLSPLLKLCLSLGCSTHGAWNVCAVWKQSLLGKRQQKNASSSQARRNQRQLSIGVEKHVLSSSSSSSWASNMASASDATTGLVWLFTWTDNDLTVRVPISLCPTLTDHASSLSSCTQLVLQGLLLTALSALMQQLVAQLIMSVYADNSDKNENRTMRDASATSASRKDALQQQNLMKRQASTRMRAEEEKNGLIVETAIYSMMTTTAARPPSDTAADNNIPQQQPNEDESFLNVTLPLQFWVLESSLELPAMSKKHLLGFHELSSSTQVLPFDKEQAGHGQVNVTSLPPLSSSSSLLSATLNSFTQWFSGFYVLRHIESTKHKSKQERPVLYVRYKFEGMVYEITVEDSQSLKLPSLRATKVSSSGSSSVE